MAGYIPSKDLDKLVWASNFSKWLAAHGEEHQITPEEISALGEAEAAAVAASAHFEKLQAAARDAAADKKAAFGQVGRLARKLARRVQADPDTTDDDRAAAGITVVKKTKTPKPAVDIMRIVPPLVVAEYTGGDEVVLHWGPNPTNENHNGRPAGTYGCEIQVARGGIPEDEAAWVILDFATKSPFRHSIDLSGPVAFAYRIRYVNKKHGRGAFGEPVVFAVSMGPA